MTDPENFSDKMGKMGKITNHPKSSSADYDPGSNVII